MQGLFDCVNIVMTLLYIGVTMHVLSYSVWFMYN